MQSFHRRNASLRSGAVNRAPPSSSSVSAFGVGVKTAIAADKLAFVSAGKVSLMPNEETMNRRHRITIHTDEE